MARTRFEDLFDPNVQEGIRSLIALIKELQEEQARLARTRRQSLQQRGEFGNVEELQKVEKELQDVNALTKENEKLKKTQIQLNARLTAQRTEEAQSVANLRDQINQNNRALRNNSRRRREAVGSLNRLRATLNETRRRYDALSEAERNNEKIGGRLLNLIQRQDKQLTRLEKTTGRAQRRVGFYSDALNGVRGVLGRVAAAAGITFGISALGRQISEAIDLAGRLEGVQNAFNRLNRPGLLSELQEGTAGTVSNLQLMQQAVQAENLGVNIESLGTLFEFARRRAAATGESVEFLTDSIVKGIGRQSPLILDNLGISASRLSEEFQRTGDFAEATALIVEEELANMGEDIETSVNSTARLSAAWDNLTTRIGGVFAPTVANILEDFVATLETAEERQKALNDSIASAAVNEFKDFRNRLSEIKGETVEWNEAAIIQVNTLRESIRLAKERGDVQLAEELTREALAILQFARAQQAANEVIEESVTSIDSLNEELRFQTELRNASQIGSEAFIASEKEIQRISDEIALALGKQTEAQKELNKEREKARKQAEKDRQEAQRAFEEGQASDIERTERELEAQLRIQELIATTERARIEAIIARRDADLEDLDLTESERILIITQAEKDIFDVRQEFRDQEAEAEKEAAEQSEELRKQQVEAAIQAVNEIARIQQDASKERISRIDDELKASENRSRQLERLAERQSEDAVNNLAFEQRRQAELRREREQEIERQKRTELGLAALNTFSNKVQSGEANPLVSTIRDITLLTQFIRSIPSFFEGTEDTGTGGNLDTNGGKLTITHDNERIMTKAQNKRLNGISNEALADLGEAYTSGNLTDILEAPRLRTYRFQSNQDILNQLDKLETSVVSAVKDIDIPDVKWDYDAREESIVQTVKKRHGLEKNHKRVGRMF